MAERKNELMVYVNGKHYPESEAKISVFDHGLLYGDGIYDTMCGWNGYIFKLDQHIDRLYRSAHAVKIEIPLKKDEFKRCVVETARLNKEKNQYIKCVVTRGVGPEPLLDPRGCKVTTIIFARPYLWLINPKKQEEGIRVKITTIKRTPDDCLDGKIKNLNYMNIVLAKLEAIESGMDEAIMPGADGSILEGPGYNVFIASKNIIITPPASNILMGVTRETVLEMAKILNLEAHEQKISHYDIYNADEAFLSSTAGGIVPIVQVDGRTIGTGKPGPIAKKLYKLYFEWLESGKHGTPFLS